MREEIDILDMLCASEGISITNKEIANFNQLIQGVHLGAIFEELCIDEEWDKLFVKESLIKYALHQIKQDSMKLNYEEKIRVEDYGADEIDGMELGSILEETHFTDPKSYFDFFGDVVLNSFSLKKIPDVQSLSKKIFDMDVPYEYSEKPGNEFNEVWYSHSLKSGSFFRLYEECEVRRAKKAFKTPKNKLSSREMKSFISELVEHYQKYNLILHKLPSKYDVSEDIFNFEKESDLFFLLKAFALLKKDDWLLKKSPNRRTNILKVISSFVLVDDINLKLHILERFINQGSVLNYTSTKTLGYLPLFRLMFVQLPMLQQKLEQIIDDKDEPLANSQRARQIKIKFKRYIFLRETICYSADHLNLLLSEEDISLLQNYINDNAENEYDDIFMELYKNVKKIRGIAKVHMSEIKTEVDDGMKSLSTLKVIEQDIDWRGYVELILQEQIKRRILTSINFINEF